jgi:hypothetical protein
MFREIAIDARRIAKAIRQELTGERLAPAA